MSNIHQQKSASEENTSQDEESQEDQPIDPTEQDSQQFGFAIQFLGALTVLKSDRFFSLKDVYKVVTDPKLAEKLLDFNHPVNLAQTQSCLRISENELKRKRNMKRGFTETNLLFWKSAKITPEQLQRAKYATIIAKRLHQKINRHAYNLKIQAHIERFGLNPQNSSKIQKDLEAWVRSHPGSSINDALITDSRRLYQEQGKNWNNDEEKKLREGFAEKRKQAIAEHKEMAERAKAVLSRRLDPNSPLPLKDQRLADIKEIEHGVPPSVAPAVPPASIPSPTPPHVSVPKPPNLPGLPRINFPRINFGGFGKSLSNFASSISKLLQPFSQISNMFKSAIGSLAKKVFSTLLSKIGATAIKQALGSLLPGIGNAAMLAWDGLNAAMKRVLGFNLEDGVKWAAVFIVAVPVGLALFMFLFMNKPSHTTPYFSSSSSLRVKPGQQNSAVNWDEFKNNFLTLKKQGGLENNLSWEKFSNIYLSYIKSGETQ